MPRLSIVIPALGRIAALEQSLVSVLANRPDDCEVLVVLNDAYGDPYALVDEVRFIDACPGADMVASLNVGLQQSTSPIVHVLLPGAEVTDGWVDDVLPRFSDPRIAAVAPKIVAAEQSGRILATGLKYNAGGARQLRKSRALSTQKRDQRQARSSDPDILGPVLTAAFYRKEVLWDLLGGFESGVGGQLCDVDAALRIRHAGYRSQLAIDSTVVASLEPNIVEHPFRAGQTAARLFWRNVPIVGVWSAVARRPIVALGQTLSWNPVTIVAHFLGSLAATFEIGRYRRHYRHLTVLHERVTADRAATDRGALRIDSAEDSPPVSHGGESQIAVDAKRNMQTRETFRP